jgi:hypothetical protein
LRETPLFCIPHFHIPAISFTFISMKKWILILSSAMLYIATSAQCTSDRYTRQVFPAVTTTSGIQFGSAMPYNGLIPQSLYLDLYEPTGDTIAQRPLIVYAFGGGFLIGTRIDPPIPAYCTYLAKCGYVVASIDYRIGFNVADAASAERAVYRGVQDLRGAVRFLCQRYPQYRIDTNAIFLTGSSAGCFSGLHSCFMEQTDAPSSIHGLTLEPSDLGCMDCDVNTDNHSRMPFIRGILNHWGAIMDTNFIRPTAKDRVPVITLQGDGDNIVPYVSGPPFSLPIFPDVMGAVPIHKRMDDIGTKNELHPLYGYGHEPWLLAPNLLDTCYLYELPFMYSFLKPAPLSIVGDTAICAGYTATYSVRSDIGARYCWSLTGGTILSYGTASITVQWNTVGRHILTTQELTRNKVNGDLDSITVDVLAHPVAAFGDSVLHTHAIFSDSSIRATSWSYSFGDNSATQQIPNPTHNYGSQSTFTVRLIVSNGYCADTTYRTLRTDTCPASPAISYTISGDTVTFSTINTGALQYTWHFGDGDSATGTSVTHVYTHSQNYLVSVNGTTAKYCPVFGSTILPFRASGINDPGAAEVRIYPNPADDILHISGLPQGAQISIFDMSGQKLHEQIAEENGYILVNVSELSAGIYLLRINATNLIINQKIIRR